MNPWTEDNFLERLMPQLRRENGAQIESCPDSELLCAFTEDQVSPFLREAIAAHLTRCPKCQEIYERLGQFAKATVPAQDAEWVNAEKRLDNWMGGFLRARAAETRSELKVEPSTPVLRWKRISQAALSWKVGWAVGVAAVLAFAVAGVVLTRHGPAAPVPAQIAETRQRPPLAETSPAPPLPENPAQTNVPENGSLKVSKSEQKPHSVIGNNIPLQKSPPPAPAEAGKLGEPQAAPPAQSSGANREGTSEMAQTHIPPKPGVSQQQGGERGLRISSASHAPAPAALFRQDQTQPSSLRLEAGTYLWIRLDRTLPEDGIFTFQGTLMPPLPPAAGPGTALLDQGTEIDGSGTMKRGEVVSILLTELVCKGVRYKLRGTAGTPNMDAPGSGWAVPFYQGQELEMQLTTASVYERPSGGGESQDQNLRMSIRTHAGANRGAAPAQPKKPAAPVPPQN